MANQRLSTSGVIHRNGQNITTLFMKSLAGKLRYDDILSHFSAFGDVESVRVTNKPKCSYGFVKFTLAEMAEKALGVDFHTIAGRRVKVVAASDRHHDEATSLVMKENKTTFLDLNDDCILEILSMNCLSLNDLCSTAETCRRLKEISVRIFKRDWKWMCIRRWRGECIKPAQRILLNFGSEMLNLEVWGEGNRFGVWTTEILASVIECCSNTLPSLDLKFLTIPDTFTAKLKPLFKNLQNLTITRCTFKGDRKELFADCGSLVELNIRECDYVIAFIFENTFPKLERFERDSLNHSNSMASFVPRHKNLRSLKICNVAEPSIMESIADCKRLEELKCRIPESAKFLDLSGLGHLRELDVDCNYRNAMQTALGLNNLQLIEKLTISGAKIDSELIRTLSQLQRLRTLKFISCAGLFNWNQMGDVDQLTKLEIRLQGHVELDIVHLVERLTKLTCLAVDVHELEMDWEKYLQIVDVVRRRADGSKLTFVLARIASSIESARAYCDNLRNVFARNAHIVKMNVNHTVL